MVRWCRVALVDVPGAQPGAEVGNVHDLVVVDVDGRVEAVRRRWPRAAFEALAA